MAGPKVGLPIPIFEDARLQPVTPQDILTALRQMSTAENSTHRQGAE